MTLVGFLLALLSAFLHAAWNVVARKVTGSPGVILLALWAACLATLPLLPFQATSGDLSVSNLGFTLVTGILLAVYVALLSEAYGVQELSYVYPISRGVGLVGTVVAGILIFGEKLNAIGSGCLLLICVGTVGIGFEKKYWRWQKGVLLAVLPGVALIFTYVMSKGIAHRMSPLGYSFGMYLVAATALTPVTLARHRGSLSAAWRTHKLAAVFIGVASLWSYAVLLLAFRTDNAGHLVAVRELSVAIAAVGGYCFLGERITLRHAMGIAAIVLGAIALKLSS